MSDPAIDYVSDEQKLIVESNAQYKSINGCAGSRKTDTLIKCILRDLREYGRPILALTMVGSVTDEIKTRFETLLGMALLQRGTTNNYIGFWYDPEDEEAEPVPICVSNFDAWVHHMLQTYTPKDVPAVDGDLFDTKVTTLHLMSQVAKLPIQMRTGDRVGLLMLDEAQDLRGLRMSILVNCARHTPKMAFNIAGDYLQSIFAEAEIGDTQHPLDHFSLLDNVARYDLSICFRCPKAHVLFNNAIMREFQQNLELPPMRSNNDNLIDKPLLFTHAAMFDNGAARINAEQIARMLGALMTADTSIVPSDVAVIMTKTNDNSMFTQLQDTLNAMYFARGFPRDSAFHMLTKADGTSHSLDWKRAEQKTVLLSIHGDKGRGHKVVFFLGCTDGSIPRTYGPPVVSQSLMNVAITRSTKYLFIGFVPFRPSRYLGRLSSLRSLVYMDWESPEQVPEPYRSVIAATSDKRKPVEQKYENVTYKLSETPRLFVSTHIAHDFECPSHFAPSWDWIGNMREFTFGNAQQCADITSPQQLMLLGNMAELLVQRCVSKAGLCAQMRPYADESAIIYTDDERFISFMHDLRGATKAELDAYVSTKRAFFGRHPAFLARLRETVFSGKRVVHSMFSTSTFRADFTAYLSDVANDQLSPSCCWNMTLFYRQTMQNGYDPCAGRQINALTTNIDVLHANVAKFASAYLTGHDVRFEITLDVIANLLPNELAALQLDKPHKVSMLGRCDLWDYSNDGVIEIKASSAGTCSRQWITQAAMYASLLNLRGKNIKYISVVNLLSGRGFTWDMPVVPDMVRTVNILAKKYAWHPVELAAMQRWVGVMREHAASLAGLVTHGS